MSTRRGSSAMAGAVAALMSFLLVFVPFTAGGGSAFADAGPYTPLPEVTPAYSGPLTWVNHTAPILTPGSMPGTTDYYIPYSLDMDDDDNVYVTKFSYQLSLGSSVGKVEKLSNNGRTVTDITYNAALNNPIGIAVDKVGNVYVSDNSKSGSTSSGTNVARILMLPNGTDSWVNLTYNAAFKYALGVAVDHQGNVYAIDGNITYDTTTTKRILMLPNGETSWDDITGTPSPFTFPIDIAVDGEGNVFVSDWSNTQTSGGGNIYKRSAGSAAWTNVAPPPSAMTGAIPFVPQGIDVDKYDNVYAMSVLGGKVMKLRYNGGSNDWAEVEVMTDPNPLSFTYYFDVAADSSGYLYSTNLGFGNISRLMASVIYNGNGNTGGTVPAGPVGYAPNVTATVYGNTGNLTKTGFVFGGWNTAPDVTGTTYAPGDTISMTQSVTLYAVWTPIPSYTVSYQAAAGGSISGLGSETVNGGGSPASVPTVMPDPGYTFLGWSSDGGTTLLTGDQLASAVVTGPITYTAYFRAPVTLTGLVLDSARYSLDIGSTHQTVASAVYSDHSTLALTSGVSYSSSNPSVATVSGAGLVTAVADGQAVITAEYEGRQAQANVTVEAASSTSPGGSPGGPAGAPNPKPGVEIIVDGVRQEQLATVRQDMVNGQSVATIVLDSRKVIEKLERENNKLLTIPLSGNNPIVVGQLTGSLVKAMESNDARIQIVTDKATYTLPASQIRIDSISTQVGAGVKLEDITVLIQISETSADKAAQVQAAAQRDQLEMVVHPVDFEISASYGSQTVQANKFNSYVGRMIALPEGIDTTNITTGVVLTAEGELFHVPTVVVRQDGKTYALINSLTNSTYSVMYNVREMNDVKDHWAKADVNDMSSRLIVQGVTETEFRPDAPITRAEFAAIVTRSLGVQGAPYADVFSDVGTNSWYAGAVQAAVEYKLIDGYEDGTFRPNHLISRQEATAVLSRAAGIAKLKPELSAEEVNRLLSAFTDGGDVAGWARTSVASAIGLNLMNGRDDRLDVEAHLTRAETAALVRRLLQAANLINS